MTDGVVVLGGYVFQDFEIPEEINWGGKQQLKIHDMVGGSRTVDAMGPSPIDISWKGRFRGSNAISNARMIDAMRASGAQVELQWLGLIYMVVIESFEPRTEKYYEVPYTIKCVVVDDPFADLAGGLTSSLDSMVNGDLSSASFTSTPA